MNNSRRTLLETSCSVVLFLAALLVPLAKADLKVSTMSSVEWLVDESRFIVIAEFESENNFDNPEIVRTIKGDADQLRLPIKSDETTNKSCGAYGCGKVRLLYMKDDSTVLDCVRLARPKSVDPNLNLSVYGVTQFGELLLSESALYRAIDVRARTMKNPTLDMVSKHVPLAPVNFPLNASNELFALRVQATPVYDNSGSIHGDAWKATWNVQSVRDAAARAIQFIKENP